MNETSHQDTPKATSPSNPKQKAQRHQQAGSEAGTAKQEAVRAVEDAKQGTRRAAETMKAGAASVAEDIQSSASDAATRAKQEGRDFLHRQKDRAAEEVSHFEAAIRRAGETLRDEQDENLAHYADRAAGELSRLKDYLHRQDLSDLLRDVENTARRRPEMILGGLFVAGLATARFLKASSRQRARDRHPGRRRGPMGDHLEYAGAHQPTSANAPLDESRKAAGDFAITATPTRSGQI
jgi:hypothetical protein